MLLYVQYVLLVAASKTKASGTGTTTVRTISTVLVHVHVPVQPLYVQYVMVRTINTVLVHVHVPVQPLYVQYVLVAAASKTTAAQETNDRLSITDASIDVNNDLTKSIITTTN